MIQMCVLASVFDFQYILSTPRLSTYSWILINAFMNMLKIDIRTWNILFHYHFLPDTCTRCSLKPYSEIYFCHSWVTTHPSSSQLAGAKLYYRFDWPEVYIPVTMEDAQQEQTTTSIVTNRDPQQTAVVAIENSSPEVIHVLSVSSAGDTPASDATQVVSFSGLGALPRLQAINLGNSTLTLPVTLPSVSGVSDKVYHI